MHLLTIEDLSKILHKSISTLQTDLYRAPHRLPPMIRLPATRKPLWRPQDVENWINGHIVAHEPPPRPRKRGRPTRKEQIEGHRCPFSVGGVK